MPVKTWNDDIDLGRGIASLHNFETTMPTPVFTPSPKRPFHQTSGGGVKNYRAKIRRVQSAVGNYTATHNSYEVASGSGRCLVKNSGFPVIYDRTALNGVYCDVVTAGAHSLDASEADLQARSRFWAAVNRERQHLLGGVFLGEIGKTLSMIRSPAKALFDNILGSGPRRRKRLGRENKKNRRRVASELWLESVFGWLPLIGDVRAGAEALAALTFLPPTKYISAGGEGNQVVLDKVDERSLGYFRILNRHTTVNSNLVRYMGVVKLDTGKVSQRQRNLFGFSWSSVLPTVWELMPFSFLTDYFFNVGDVIASHCAGAVPIAWACKSQVKKQTETSEVVGYTTSATGNDVEVFCYLSPCKLTSRWVQFTRTEIHGVDFPTLSGRLPHGLQWLNLAALSQACRF